MPMSFPDFNSLKQHAEMVGFRQPAHSETEESFRTALADFVENIDVVESQEIRNKVGWDKFTDSQNFNMLLSIMQRNRK